MPINRQTLQELNRSKDAAVAFLLKHVAEDGFVPQDQGRVTIYRLPWALAVVGETEAASRVLNWIERHTFANNGEFQSIGQRDVVANHTFNTYPETCLAFGAHMLQRFDIAQRAMNFAREFQDPVTGGIFMDREEVGDDAPQLLFITCQFGISALMTGCFDAAMLVAHWLDRLWAAQPALPYRLFTVWTRNGGLVTHVPEGEDRRHFVNESQQIREFHYNGGIAAAFLASFALWSSDSRWLDLAEKYQRFSIASTERQFETRQVCKSAWGASQIASATNDIVYIDWLWKMGQWFVSIQDDDGHWSNSAYLENDPTVEHKIEVTAEFVIHLNAIISSLAAQ